MGFNRSIPYIIISDPFPVLLPRTILKRPVQQCKPGDSQDENRFGLVSISDIISENRHVQKIRRIFTGLNCKYVKKAM
jgi:hypothetical protein